MTPPPKLICGLQVYFSLIFYLSFEDLQLWRDSYMGMLGVRGNSLNIPTQPSYGGYKRRRPPLLRQQHPRKSTYHT